MKPTSEIIEKPYDHTKAKTFEACGLPKESMARCSSAMDKFYNLKKGGKIEKNSQIMEYIEQQDLTPRERLMLTITIGQYLGAMQESRKVIAMMGIRQIIQTKKG